MSKALLEIIQGNALGELKELPACSVHCCVTSPPYWGLRDYGVAGQIGLEKTPEEWCSTLVEVFREVRRVLHPSGTLWLNVGDVYCCDTKWGGSSSNKNELEIGDVKRTRKWQSGCKPKDLIGLPWMLAFALRADGWWLRSDIIWAKPNPMPESVTDRPTKSHEYLFLLSKSERYFWDAEAIKERVENVQPPRRLGRKEYEQAQAENGHVGARAIALETGQGTETSMGNHFGRIFGGEISRNRRSVWTIPTEANPEAHFASFPTDLVKPCVLAGTSAKGVCPKCGEPWGRMVEREPGFSKECPGTIESHLARGRIGVPCGTVGKSGGSRIDGTTKTLGWSAGCDCDGGDPEPAVVLDPFCGTGTTCAVALELGRRAIGLELNPEYVEMGRRRCSKVTPGFPQLA